MKTKLLNLGILSLTIFMSAVTYGQDITLNDFESGSPVVTASYGAEYANVANPLTAGNPTANCGQIKRTSGNWYELIRFDTSFNVPANTSKYIHLMVMYTSAVVPNISIRVDAAADNDGSVDIHPTNNYTNSGAWQDLVFKIDGGTSGITPTQILFFADSSVNVLNSTDSFAYIDQMVLNNTETPDALKTDAFQLNNTVTIYPNPTNALWNFTSANSINFSSVQIIDITGKTVLSKDITSQNITVDASNLSAGMYVAKITSGNAVQTFKVIKN